MAAMTTVSIMGAGISGSHSQAKWAEARSSWLALMIKDLAPSADRFRWKRYKWTRIKKAMMPRMP